MMSLSLPSRRSIVSIMYSYSSAPSVSKSNSLLKKPHANGFAHVGACWWLEERDDASVTVSTLTT
ncbi:hypothetical protein BJV77DRAFT_636233 [Russula vinacea]|nr:hypothetical protein BJV77DRAFT_636233 [Russula vinacea]